VKGDYRNPTRQRGIFGHAAEQPKLNPSLTRRVVKPIQSTTRFLIAVRGFSQLLKLNASKMA